MASSNDAAALERVRNRLASSPDTKLPQILSKLLPRLLTRFDSATTPTNNEAARKNATCVDPNLVGILEHVRERILLNCDLVQACWVEPLLQAVVQPPGGGEDDSSAANSKRWILQLQYTLPILELALLPSSVCFLPQVMSILEGLHSVLPTVIAKEKNESEAEAETEGQNEGLSSQKIEVQQVWEQISWMVVEQLAKACKVTPVLDWNSLGNDWDEFHSSASWKKIEEYHPTQEEQNIANGGMFHLLLDAISFDPRVRYGSSSSRCWEFRRETERIQRDFDHAQRQRNAHRQLAQMQHGGTRGLEEQLQHDIQEEFNRQIQEQLNPGRVSQRRNNPTSWNQAELHYWRAIQQCLRSYAIELYSSQPEREDILRIITVQPKPSSTLPMYKRIKASQMNVVNCRKRAKAAVAEQSRQNCSLIETTAFLHLILGDAQTKQIREKYDKQSQGQESWPYLALLGSLSGVSSKPLPSSSMTLLPLPPVTAQQVFSHVLQADVDLTEGQRDNDISKHALAFCVDLLFEVRNASSLQTPVSSEIYERIGAQTPPSMCRTVHFLYKLVADLSQDKNNNSEHGVPTELARRSYDSAIDLLSNLQDVAVQRLERERRLARRRNLLHEQRVKHAGRSEFVMEALQARSDAYQIVTKFVTQDKILLSSGSDGEKELSWDMAILALNCMAFDDKRLTVLACRETCAKVLSLYRHVVVTSQQQENGSLKIPSINPLLLPLLKACISASDSSRAMAIEWAVSVIYHVDPYICQTILVCLSSDDVSAIATKATEAMQQISFSVSKDSTSTMEASFGYWDLAQDDSKHAIVADMKHRITTLTERHSGMSSKTARKALEAVGFSVEAADTALHDDSISSLSSSKYFDDDRMDVDNSIADKDHGNCLDNTLVDVATCEVCWDDIPNGEGFALECAHTFCLDCWRGGLEAATGGPSFKELANFSCLHHDCDERMTPEDAIKVAPSLAPAVEEASLKWFVLSSSDYAFCPGPDCSVVARRPNTSHLQQADCRVCGTSFCFQCGNEPHAPVSCDVRRTFMAARERLQTHEEEVENKTITCPGCGMGITKNGGCNHMTCSQCGHEFCWICLSSNWQDHVCNVYDTLNGVDDLQRMQFFRRRVDAHLMSADAVRNLLNDFDAHAQELKFDNRLYQDSHLYVLKEAWKTLVSAREFLANSYIASYGMNETVDAEGRREFEDHQAQLQLFVEQLNLLSDKVSNLRSSDRQEDFQVQFRGLHFCTVAVAGYIQRVESCVHHHTSALGTVTAKKPSMKTGN